MIEVEPQKQVENVCNFKYLIEMMHGKKHLINEMIDAFLIEIPKELDNINKAITEENYTAIKNFTHTIMSSVSIMGISTLVPILQEMEGLGAAAVNIEKIIELNKKLNSICEQAMEEIEREKHKYI